MKPLIELVLAVFAVSSALAQQNPTAARQYDANSIMFATDADQIKYFTAQLNDGLRHIQDGAVGSLLLARSSVFFPILERKIEEVLRSTNPQDCFSDPSVDATQFVDKSAFLLTKSGDELAMKEIAKLVAIDELPLGTSRKLADSLHDDIFRLAVGHTTGKSTGRSRYLAAASASREGAV